MICPKCGCQGHGRVYLARCAVCKEIKYPTMPNLPDGMPNPPTESWVCTLCRALGGEKRAGHRKGGLARARQRERQERTGATPAKA